jgi:HEAT repeat protein
LVKPHGLQAAAGRGILPTARTDHFSPAGGQAMPRKRTVLWLGFIAIALTTLAWLYWSVLYSKYVAYRLMHADGCAVAPWVERGVHHPSVEIRLRAIQVAMRAEVQHLEPVRLLLNDAAPEVRHAALLALSGATDILSDDELLYLLHDPDAEVKRLCRTTLRGRGLREADVQLGRLFASPQPADRLQLLSLLYDDGELDIATWLQRLSRDPCPAVRAAAARSAGEQQVVAMQKRLAEMASSDPDLTVRPIAKFHCQQLQHEHVRPAGGVTPR